MIETGRCEAIEQAIKKQAKACFFSSEIVLTGQLVVFIHQLIFSFYVIRILRDAIYRTDFNTLRVS